MISQEKKLGKVKYGLGLSRMKTPFGFACNYSGDAIIYFATTSYFPEKNMATSWATDGNYGKLDDVSQSKEAFQQVFEKVFGKF
ncbi:hypothetical protein C8N25_113127 [Algoriphagus antarcticus]|uniref:Beta-lactamase n=1 Tax=Algoriphagus antarcticus TaxID=238540 RepID=A0A3E0DQN6_9BACT|nr:hypothetical protein C8N25_113127 [Algoriphagus antarcticus]